MKMETDKMDAEKQDQTCVSCGQPAPTGKEWCVVCDVLRAGPYDTYHGHLGLPASTDLCVVMPRVFGVVTGWLKVRWNDGVYSLTGFSGSMADGKFLAKGRNARHGEPATDVVLSGKVEGQVVSGTIKGSFSGKAMADDVPFSASRLDGAALQATQGEKNDQ